MTYKIWFVFGFVIIMGILILPSLTPVKVSYDEMDYDYYRSKEITTQRPYLKITYNLSDIPKDATIENATLQIKENLTICRGIGDCIENSTLIGCKMVECNTCCCPTPGWCVCTLVYCSRNPDDYYWDYQQKEWIKK